MENAARLELRVRFWGGIGVAGNARRDSSSERSRGGIIPLVAAISKQNL